MAKSEHQSDDISIRQLIYIVSALSLISLLFHLVWLLWPLLRVVLPLLVGGWLWHHYQQVQVSQGQTLNAIFYQLLQTYGGRITVLDFAMTTRLSAIAARHYLDDRAKEFFAHFEVTDQGDVIYVFPTLVACQPLVDPALNPEQGGDRSGSASGAELSCLTSQELARRLGVALSTVRRKKFSSQLSAWSRSLDPDGIGWSYLAQSRRFFPVVADRPSSR